MSKDDKPEGEKPPVDPRVMDERERVEQPEHEKDKQRLFSKVFPLAPSEKLPEDVRDDIQMKIDLELPNAAVYTAQPKEVGFASRPTGEGTTDAQKDEEFLKDRVEKWEVRQEARKRFQDLEHLRDELAKRNMKPGKVLGFGSIGVVFELENMKGQEVESAVIRIDPSPSVGAIDNPGAAKVLFREKSGDFTASILARGKPMDKDLSSEDRYKLVEQTMAVLNSTNIEPRKEEDKEGKLPHYTHLDMLKDVSAGQFMKMPGIDLPQLADLSSMENGYARKGGMGNIDSYIENYDRPASIRTTLAPPEVVETMTRQADALAQKVAGDIQAKGIDISVPTQMRGAEGEDVSKQQGRTAPG